MKAIQEQYFDFSMMAENFGEVFHGFLITIELSIVAGALALIWGLVLALLRQLPGRAFIPIRFATPGTTRDRVHGRMNALTDAGSVPVCFSSALTARGTIFM